MQGTSGREGHVFLADQVTLLRDQLEILPAIFFENMKVFNSLAAPA
jgi:hypothetical protein